MIAEYAHKLERTILISATRSTVFQYFTDSNLFADWWGEGSSIEGRVGGALRIRYPNGIVATGEVLEILPLEKIVFTYGYDSGTPIPPGASRVTISLLEHEAGTELKLCHEFSDASVRDHHIHGWRYQLALFANVASAHQHSNAQELAKEFFEIWNTMDENTRREKMVRLLDSAVSFRDRYSCTFGIEDLNQHVSAVHQFMPGLIMSAEGNAMMCQGTVLARWTARRADGSHAGNGMNVFQLSPSGRIVRVTGFWE